MQNTQILITGISGLLGTYLQKTASKKQITGWYYGKYQMKNQENVTYSNVNLLTEDFKKEILTIRPSAIIHTASIGNVDYCENHPEDAKKFNFDITKQMYEISKEIDAHFMFISSNAVYDGNNPPYSEDQQTNPLSVYGKLKVQSEEILQQGGGNWSVVRPIIMYGWNHPQERTNPVTWLLDKFKKKESVKLVNDIYENPLFAESAAETIWKIIDKKLNGIYNVAGGSIINRYEWALQVAEVFGYDKSLISPVSSDFFKSILPRPKNTSFNTTKMQKIIGINPMTMQEGLMKMKSEKIAF